MPQNVQSPDILDDEIKSPDLDDSGNPISISAPEVKQAQPERGLLGKAWDWGTTSLTGMQEPSMQDWSERPVNSAFRSGVIGMTSPLALAGEAASAVGLVKGLSRFKKAPIVANVASKMDEVNPIAGVASTAVKKPKFRVNPDKSFSRLDEAGNEISKVDVSGKPLASKITALVEAAPIASEIPPSPKLTPDVQSYIKGMKEGTIKKGTTFDNWKSSLEAAPVEEATKAPSLVSRLIEEEEAAYTPGKIISNLRKKYGEKKIQSVRNDVINTLVQGGRLDLNGIMQKAAKAGIPKKDFNKIIDNIIDSDELKTLVKETQDNFDQLDPKSRLITALQTAKVTRAEQDALRKQDLSQRVAKFSSVKERGVAGFRKRMSMLSGEYEKVSTSPLQLKQADADFLTDEIIDSRLLTQLEKARAGTALQKAITGSEVLQPNEIQLLERALGPEVGQELMQLYGGLGIAGPVKVNIGKFANTLKTSETMLDVSASFRNGAGLALRKEFWNAYKDMFKMGREGFFKDMMDEIHSRPTYLRGREANLFVVDELKKSGKSLIMREEHYMKSFIDDLRDLGKTGEMLAMPATVSERMHVGFLNKLRQDTFDSMVREADALGISSSEFDKVIANFINSRTGRSSLGSAEKYADALNVALFSPRFQASRMEILTTLFQPEKFWQQPWMLKREALKSLASYATLIGIANGVGYAAGSKLTGNPLSSDFLKPVTGRTRVDASGGIVPYAVALARYWKNSYTTTKGETRELGKGIDPTWLNLMVGIGGRQASFLENRASPFMSLIRALLTKRDNFGKEMPPSEALVKSMTPIIAQNFIELNKEDPEKFPIDPRVLILLDAHGINVNTYEEQEPSSSMGLRAPSMSLRP